MSKSQLKSCRNQSTMYSCHTANVTLEEQANDQLMLPISVERKHVHSLCPVNSKKINISLFDWTGASSITVLLPTFLYDWLARQLLEKFIKFGSPLSKWQLTIRVFVKVCFQMFISSLEFSLHMRARPDVTGESLMVQTRMNHGIFVVLWSQVS